MQTCEERPAPRVQLRPRPQLHTPDAPIPQPMELPPAVTSDVVLDIAFAPAPTPVAVDAYAASVYEHVRPLTIHSHTLDNSRQMTAQDMLERQAIELAPDRRRQTGAVGWVRSIMNLDPKVPQVLSTRREAVKRLSARDPSLAPELLRAWQAWTYMSISEMDSAGVTAQHLVGIGITFDKWQANGWGLRQIERLGGGWDEAVGMAFGVDHMVRDRDQSGAAVLAGDPFRVTLDMLVDSAGFVLDTAVFKLGMNFGDLRLLAPKMGMLMRHGLENRHLQELRVSEIDLETEYPGDFSDEHRRHLFPEDPNAPLEYRPREESLRASRVSPYRLNRSSCVSAAEAATNLASRPRDT